MMLLMWALKVNLLSTRTPKSRILSMEDDVCEEIVW